MADDVVEVRISGLQELKAVLQSIAPKLRKRALREALTVGARLIRDAARRGAPVLRASTYSGLSAIRRGVRNPGTVRNAISVRTSKASRRNGDVGVFVNVKPAKGSARGSKSPSDPFYWRFLEFGTKRSRVFTFLRPAAEKLPDALKAFEREIGPRIQKFNSNPKGDI